MKYDTAEVFVAKRGGGLSPATTTGFILFYFFLELKDEGGLKEFRKGKQINALKIETK